MCALSYQALKKGGCRDGSPERSDPLGASELGEEGGVGTQGEAGVGKAWDGSALP